MQYQITGVSLTDVWHCAAANKLEKAIETAKIFAASSPNFHYFKVTDKDGNRIVAFNTLT